MKKIVSALVAVLMLSTVAFGAEYSITNQDFNRVADEITVNYSGHSGEYMTVFVYDVTSIAEASENTPWDVDNTPITQGYFMSVCLFRFSGYKDTKLV